MKPLPSKPDILPEPFEWCHVPAGEVTKLRVAPYNKGQVIKKIILKDFFISKYLITVAQFKSYIQDTGYIIERVFPSPPNLDDNPLNAINHVTWHEAVQFAQWLSNKMRYHITLPTDAQWQRAAQGDDGRLYPWGNDYNPQKCNVGDSGIGEPTPVNSYPEGASPYGVFDMIGNVFEWCLTDLITGENTENVPDKRENPHLQKIFCGSSYGTSKYGSTIERADGATPIMLSYLTGIRLVTKIESL